MENCTSACHLRQSKTKLLDFYKVSSFVNGEQQSLHHNFFQVQIRPWNLADSDYVMDGGQPLDPRKTIFVGGVPRPLKARKHLVIT